MKKLRQFSRQVAVDPDLAGFAWGGGEIIYNKPETVQGKTTLADVLGEAVALLEDSNAPLIASSEGTFTAKEYEERTIPDRKVSLQRYVLLNVFDWLEPHFSKRSKRAPNNETETLCSVLLDETIKPGTVTHLRKDKRRHYYPDKE